jgi:hypothetical protein
MADLADQHITDLHRTEAWSDIVQSRSRTCSLGGSIYDRRGRVFHGPALPSLALTADTSVGGITIKIG